MISLAHAAELVAVSPPTDWIGIAIIAAIMFVIVALVGYIVHIKRTPGVQFGEDEIERIAESLFNKQQYKGATITTSDPLFYDGTQFETAVQLEEYKAAKAVIAKHKGESP